MHTFNSLLLHHPHLMFLASLAIGLVGGSIATYTASNRLPPSD